MQSSLQLGSVFHNRIFPYNHRFKYKTLSILINLNELNNINKLFLFSINTFNLFSFFFKDHGARNENNNPKNFILKNIAKKFNDKKNYTVYLYCTPSFLGYVFNPISIYLYKFYLLNSKNNFLLNIDVYKKNQIILKTGITSKTLTLNSLSLIYNLIKNVFFAQKVMILIHYQAIKIFKKQKSFFSKPQKNNDTVSFHG